MTLGPPQLTASWTEQVAAEAAAHLAPADVLLRAEARVRHRAGAVGAALRRLPKLSGPGHGAGVRLGRVPGARDVIRNVRMLSLEDGPVSAASKTDSIVSQDREAGDFVMEVGECLEEDILELEKTAHLMLEFLKHESHEIAIVVEAGLYICMISIWVKLVTTEYHS